ncbi:MAG: hypothetical protein ACK4GC_15930 [Paracoccaceae bacterium]
MILDFLNAYRADLQYIVGILLGLAMWRWGGGPERGMAVLFTGVLIIPSAGFRLFSAGTMIFGNFQGLYIALDVVALVGFVLIGLNANRNYPLWVAAFQMVAVGSHLVRAMVDAVSPLAYMVMAVGPSYCQIALLIAGLLRHRARTRRFGPYRDWRTGHGFPRLAAALSAKT